MELQEVLDKMVNFESLVEPQEMVAIVGHIGGFITDFELQYDEAKLAYSLEWEKVKYETENGKPNSDKLTEIKMMRNPTYAKLMHTKRTLGELKRYRSDLNRKLDVIMGIKRRS